MAMFGFRPWLGFALPLNLAACGGGGSGDAAVTDRTAALAAAASYATALPQEELTALAQLNTWRTQCGLQALTRNNQLDTVASNHANYTQLNQDYGHDETPGLSGYTGETLALRREHVGYPNAAGEVISEAAFWAEGQTMITTWSRQPNTSSSQPLVMLQQNAPLVDDVRALMALPYHGLSMLSNTWVEAGLGSYIRVDENTVSRKGLVLNLGQAADGLPVVPATVDAQLVTFPCQGSSGLNPYFVGEFPDPYPSVNRDLAPMGHPIYLMDLNQGNLSLTSHSLRLGSSAGQSVPTRLLTHDNDQPDGVSGATPIVAAHQLAIVPEQGLQQNATYWVTLSGTSTSLVTASNPSGAFTRTFSFSTADYHTLN